MNTFVRRSILKTGQPFLSVRQGFARIGLLLALLVVVAGCKKAAEPVAQTVPESNQATVAAHNPTPAATAPAGQPAVPSGQPDLEELNRSLLRWLMANRRPPKDFEDFAATAGVPIPPPPAGKKYVIAKNMHIQLVNR